MSNERNLRAANTRLHNKHRKELRAMLADQTRVAHTVAEALLAVQKAMVEQQKHIASLEQAIAGQERTIASQERTIARIADWILKSQEQTQVHTKMLWSTQNRLNAVRDILLSEVFQKRKPKRKP